MAVLLGDMLKPETEPTTALRKAKRMDGGNESLGNMTKTMTDRAVTSAVLLSSSSLHTQGCPQLEISSDTWCKFLLAAQAAKLCPRSSQFLDETTQKNTS